MIQPATDTILVIDVGTSSARASLYTTHGERLPPTLQRPSHLKTTPNGGATANPHDLQNTLVELIDAITQQTKAPIRAVVMSQMLPTLVGIDTAGHPLTPVYTYADTTNSEALPMLARLIPPETLFQRTGTPLHTSYWPARLLWLAHTDPALAQQGVRWLSFGDFFYHQLFGVAGTSLSTASWTGLLNRETLTWDAALVAALPIEISQLPTIMPLAQPLVGLRSPWATRWPALQDVPWLLPIGDGACATVGSGSLGPGQLTLTVGTSGALRAVLPTPPAQVPTGLWLYRIDPTRALLGGATTEGGGLFAWLKQTLNLPPPPSLEEALAALPPDGHGLTILPFLAGERSPGWHADARATIHGLGLATTPVEILRAALEAVALRFALIADCFPEELIAGAEIIANGGALMAAPSWVQIFADALGLPLVLSAEKENTSRGAALLALEALGLVPDLHTLTPAMGARFLPNWENHTIYRAALARQMSLYAQVFERQEP